LYVMYYYCPLHCPRAISPRRKSQDMQGYGWLVAVKVFDVVLPSLHLSMAWTYLVGI
jgi:hypothetical protein